MQTIISNKITIKNPSQEIYLWAKDHLVITNPKWATLKKLGKDDQISRYHIEKDMYLFSENGLDLVLPFGVLYAVWPMIKSYSVDTVFNNHGIIMNPYAKITQPLFDYQEEAVKELIKAKGGILEAGCGSGKTNIGIALVHTIGQKFLWLCHTKDLLNQTLARIKFLYPDMEVGTITDGKIAMGRDGTIATVQTLVEVDPDIYRKEFDVVITDECHHVSGSEVLLKQFTKIISKIPARYKYGLTATPSRGDTLIKTMYTTIGCNTNGEFAPTFKIDRSKTNTLTASHSIVPIDIEMSFDFLNADGTFDYNKLIDFLSENHCRNRLICEKIVEVKNSEGNHKQLVLCHRVEHCEYLHNELTKLGLNSKLLVGKVSTKKRKEILSSTDFDVIVGTYSLAKEGLDVPILSDLHLTTPQKNKAIVVQSVGRIERVCDNKPSPVVYDYVDVQIPYCLGAYKKRKNQIKNRY